MSKGDKADLINKKGYVSKGTDVNTLQAPGCYTLVDGIVNAPGRYGTLIVFPCNFYIVQMFVNGTTAKFRCLQETGTWYDWITIGSK